MFKNNFFKGNKKCDLFLLINPSISNFLFLRSPFRLDPNFPDELRDSFNYLPTIIFEMSGIYFEQSPKNLENIIYHLNS